MTVDALPLPVNIPEASEDPSARIHGMIRAELADLGEVVDISGSITVSERESIILSDVVVTVEHARIRVPLKLAAIWDATGERMIYRDRSGMEFIPPSSSEDEDDDYDIDESAGISDYDREIAAAVFAQLDSHAAVASVPAPLERSRVAAPAASVAAGTGGGSLVDLLTAAPDLAVTAGGALVAAAGLAYGGRGLWRNVTASKSYQAAAYEWNESPVDTITDVFSSEEDRLTFMDSFCTAAEAHGLSHLSDLQLTTRPESVRLARTMDQVHVSGGMKHSLNLFPFRSYMMRVNAHAPHPALDTTPEERAMLYWDGIHFYARFAERDGLDGQRPRFFPLSPLSTLRETTESARGTGSVHGVAERLTYLFSGGTEDDRAAAAATLDGMLKESLDGLFNKAPRETEDENVQAIEATDLTNTTDDTRKTP